MQKHAGCAHFLGPSASCFFPNISKPPSGGAGQEALSCHHAQQHAPMRGQHASATNRLPLCGCGCAAGTRRQLIQTNGEDRGQQSKRPRRLKRVAGPFGIASAATVWAAASGWGQPAARGSALRSCVDPHRSFARLRSLSCGGRSRPSRCPGPASARRAECRRG
jgi:hypothetical protein